MKFSEVEEILKLAFKHEHECQCPTHLKDGRIDVITEHAIRMVVEDHKAMTVMMHILSEIFVRDQAVGAAFLSMVAIATEKRHPLKDVADAFGLKIISIDDLMKQFKKEE